MEDSIMSQYGVPEAYFKDYVLNSAGNWEMTKLAISGANYEQFKDGCLKIIRKEFINPEDDSDKFNLNDKQFEKIDDFDLSEEDYNNMSQLAYKTLEDVRAIYNNETKNKKRYVFPIEKILNGNFKKCVIDKSKLSEDMKRSLNVHGLTDDLYDLYWNEEFDEVIPIYYDKSTCNEQWYNFSTFLEEYYRLKRIDGNHLTPLILFDRDLMGVDPDIIQSQEMMVKIMRESRRNVYYHFREIARNEPNAEGVKTKYFINIATWSFLWLYAQNKNTFRQQARQTGKTYDMGHTAGYEFSYGSDRCSIGVFHFVYNKAAENRKTWVGYANLYPNYMQVHNVVTKTTRGKVEEIQSPEPMSPSTSKVVENKKYKNKFIAIAIGTSKMAAEQAGRGSTLRLIFGDELNFIKYIKVAFTALMFAHGTARKMAEMSGLRTGMHFASTAGTLDTEQGRMMHKFIFEDMVRFDPVLFTLDASELTKFINSNSKNRFVLIDYSYKDIGLSEDWLDDTIAGKSVEENRTEIFNQWLSSTTGGLFKIDALSRLDHMVKKYPVKTWLFNKLNIFRFSAKYESFEDMIKRCGVLSIGMDFALGDLGDYTTFTGVDLLTGERLFDYEDNNIDNPDCVIMIKAFVRYILNINPTIKMVLVPEIDGPGKSVIIPSLKKDKVVEPYIFKSIQYTNKEIKEPQIKSTSYTIDEKSFMEYGTYMRRIRGVLFNSLLFELVDKYPFAFADQATSNEVKTLIKTKAGKILAKSGFHDDKVCSTLHAYSPLFVDNYQEALRTIFNIHVSISNLEADPITSTVFNLKEEEEALEGRLNWIVYNKKDEFGQEYQTIRVFKIVNASKVELSREEYEEESFKNTDLRDTLNTMKHKRVIMTSRASIRDVNDYNSVLTTRNTQSYNNMLRMNETTKRTLIKSGKMSKKNISLI